MKKTILSIIAFLAITAPAQAETVYKISGNQVTATATKSNTVDDPNYCKGAKPGANDVKTKYTFTAKDGNNYEIWVNVNSNRHYYLVKVKTGQNAGKYRRQYLPKELDSQFK